MADNECMKTNIFILLVLVTLTACASSRPLTEKEKSVRILRQSDAPKECIEKGMIYGSSMEWKTFDGIEDQMKMDAFAMDADTIALVYNGVNGYKAGKAFKCNQ